MARNHLIQALRTTQAALDSNAAANNLNAGEPYYITDADTLAIGTSANTYFTVPVVVGAGSPITQAAVRYNGTTRASGRFYGGTTNPSSTDRLNYDGELRAAQLRAINSVFVNDGSGSSFLLPDALNVNGHFAVSSSAINTNVHLSVNSVVRLLAGRITNTDTGEVNNWSPTGLSGASWIIWNGTSALGVSGMQGGVDGRIVVISTGTSSLVGIDFYHQNTGSTAANRFILPESNTLSLGPAAKAAAYRSAVFAYDGGVSRWRLIARNF